MCLTQAETDRLDDVEKNEIPALALITDEAMENRAVARETRRRAEAARMAIGPCFQIRTVPQRPGEEVGVVDGAVYMRAHAAAKTLDAVIGRACGRLYRRT